MSWPLLVRSYLPEAGGIEESVPPAGRYCTLSYYLSPVRWPRIPRRKREEYARKHHPGWQEAGGWD